ncbi:putative zinc finger protein 16-like [Scophthalmus maximus]|uniref:Putative zinc finger protein 16-like n=1 Tax=Scophthalmus maximus TaxID=52904 RepID=A0A2U9B065_SCOMX|nr:putative zinc finger protein 16-like [Scophthalmus maximus]
MKRNADESESSRARVLREFVTDRLAAASREILAAVERTVAGYEEEASGFRREIDRQRRQLELLLQPRVDLNTAGVKLGRRLRHVDEEEGDEEDEESSENPEDLNNRTSSRCQLERRRSGRPQTRETQNHVDLRIRILDDPRTEVLSQSVLKKCPMLRLKCPRGLRESDFLDLLSSTFPQLSTGHEPLDVFASDRGQRLRRLHLKALTPEELDRGAGGRAGRGTSTVFIRPRAQKEPEANEEEIHPLQTKDNDTGDSSSAAAVLTCEHVTPQTR